MTDDKDLLEDTMNNHKRAYIDFFINNYSELLKNCDSPIEKIFLVNLKFMGDLSNLKLNIKNQYEISVNDKNYKLDFYITASQRYKVENKVGIVTKSREVSLCVECDGHDFHEKTKEQVAHDKQRERNLVKAGHKLIRFTGSEIYKSPQKCAFETIKILESLLKKVEFETETL